MATGRRMRGVIVHRRRRDDAPKTAVIDGIPATGIDRTLIDLAGVVASTRVALALDDALRRGITTPAEISAALEALGSRGRTGAGALRETLERRDERDAGAESRLESALLTLLRRHDLPLPAAQHEVVEAGAVVARLDFAYPAIHLGIEADGYRWHGGRERWASDIRRENRLKLLGWTLLRFSWEDVHERPEMIAGQIRMALRRSLSSLPTPARAAEIGSGRRGN